MTDRGYMRDLEMSEEIDRLRALNAELVEALETLVNRYFDLDTIPLNKARAAIAKAKGEA